MTINGTKTLTLTGAVKLRDNVDLTVEANTVIDGVIDDGVHTFGLKKLGASTLTLNGANTYGGPPNYWAARQFWTAR